MIKRSILQVFVSMLFIDSSASAQAASLSPTPSIPSFAMKCGASATTDSPWTFTQEVPNW